MILLLTLLTFWPPGPELRADTNLKLLERDSQSRIDNQEPHES